MKAAAILIALTIAALFIVGIATRDGTVIFVCLACCAVVAAFLAGLLPSGGRR